jgi:hypothetical protein
MTEGSNFHKLLGRALVDDEFRKTLRNPDLRYQALVELGIEPTQEVLEHLGAAVEALDNLAKSEALGGGPQEVG